MHLMGMGSGSRFWRGLFFGSLMGAGLVSMMMMRGTPQTKRIIRKRMRGMKMQARRARQAMEYGAENLSNVYRMGRRTMERTFDNIK